MGGSSFTRGQVGSSTILANTSPALGSTGTFALYRVSSANGPSAPSNISATAVVGELAIDLAWTAPGSDGGASISGYQVETSTDGGSTWSTTIADSGSSNSSIRVTNLSAGTNYLFRVSAINSVGTSAASVASANISLTSPVAAPYSGPLIQNLGRFRLHAETPSTVEIVGERLNQVTAAHIDGKQLKISLRAPGSLTVEIPGLAVGIKDLVVTFDNGTLTHIEAFDVALRNSGRVNVGSFNGKLVVYAQNLDGKRISWKAGGRWGKATAVGNTLNRFDRPTPRRGVTVSVEIYVDGVKTLTKSVVTR